MEQSDDSVHTKHVNDARVASFIKKHKKSITINIHGTSMIPFISDGQIMTFDVTKEAEIGDVILFVRQKMMVVHRVINITCENGVNLYHIKGDNCNYVDGTQFTKDAIFGCTLYYINADGNTPFINRFKRLKAYISWLDAQMCLSSILVLKRGFELLRNCIFKLLLVLDCIKIPSK